MTLGARVKRLREEKRLTQRALADVVGVPSQQISRWENDEQMPSVMKAIKLAQALGVTVEQLLLGTR